VQAGGQAGRQADAVVPGRRALVWNPGIAVPSQMFSRPSTDNLPPPGAPPPAFPPACSPAFNELGEVVGIAFQSYAGSDAENIGYVIPTPVINHFLDDYQRNGTFTGFPALGVQWQRMESAALRCVACRLRGWGWGWG
jgi:hypothetical protein